tara:strand:- start:673 stop:2049 length:1377 start_codon:yes stop_codon:yes gene_type:complete
MANTKITSANLDTLTTLTVDDININNSTISATGDPTASGSDLTLDAVGDIILDAAGGDIILKNDGSTNGNIVLGDATNPTVKITSGFDIILDSASDITLDADGADIRLKDAGNTFGVLSSSGSDQFVLQAGTQDKDIIFKGNDGGSVITALTLDMSDGGKAIFGSAAQFASDISIEAASGNPSLTIKTAGTGNNPHINYRAGDNTVFDNMGVFSASTDYWRVAYGSSGSASTELLKVESTGHIDVAGIIDNTRDNGNVSAPNNSDHTAGTRIKFFDGSADVWYAIGIAGNTMWFKSDDEYAWYDGASNAVKMKLDANGDLSRPYGIYARGFWNKAGVGSVNSGTTAIYNNNNRITISSGKIYVPVAGRYLVHVQGLDNSSNSSFDTRIQHNVTGSNDAFLADLRLGNNGGGTHGSSSATSIVDMAANDYIHILRLSGTQYSAASSTSPHNSWFITYLG